MNAHMLDIGRVSSKSRIGAPSREGCEVYGHMTTACKIMITLPPSSSGRAQNLLEPHQVAYTIDPSPLK